MKQIVTPRQMRLIEETAFENGIDQLDLMEKAAQCVADELEKMTGLMANWLFFSAARAITAGMVWRPRASLLCAAENR